MFCLSVFQDVVSSIMAVISAKIFTHFQQCISACDTLHGYWNILVM